MKATYQHSWLWFLVAMLMVPAAYGQGDGTQKWAVLIGTSVSSSPAIGVDGTLYVREK